MKGIEPLEMAIPADVSVEKNADKWVLSYCAFSYANRVEDSKLKQLVNAMYRYYEAAYAYEY